MRTSEQRARVWKNLLVEAFEGGDLETFEELWANGRKSNLWIDLGYMHVDEFCRAELDPDLADLVSVLDQPRSEPSPG